MEKQSGPPEGQRFRLTTSQQEALPEIPPRSVKGSPRYEGDVAVGRSVFGDGRSGGSVIEQKLLAHEFYLRVLTTVDSHDDEAVRGFVQEHGLFVRLPYFNLQTPGRGDPADSAAQIYGPLNQMIEQHLGTYVAEGMNASGAFIRYASRVSDLLVSEQVQRPIELLEDTQRALAWFRDLISLRRTLITEESHVPPSWESEAFGIPAPADRMEAARALQSGVGAGVSWHHPHLVIAWGDDGDREPTLDRGALEWPSLYQAAMVQFFNHIAEEALYRTCDSCGRLFVRQHGRSRQQQWRTTGNLLYCSKTCSDREAQRKRRAKAKRTGGSR